MIVAFSSNATKGGAWSAAAAFSRSPPASGLSTASRAARAAFSSANASKRPPRVLLRRRMRNWGHGNQAAARPPAR